MKSSELLDGVKKKLATMTGPGTSTATVFVERIEELRNLWQVKGPSASAERRRVRTDENKKKWRARAHEIWLAEAFNDDFPSPREEVAERIAAEEPLARRPKPGTVREAIKGVKANALRAGKREREMEPKAR